MQLTHFSLDEISKRWRALSKEHRTDSEAGYLIMTAPEGFTATITTCWKSGYPPSISIETPATIAIFQLSEFPSDAVLVTRHLRDGRQDLLQEIRNFISCIE